MKGEDMFPSNIFWIGVGLFVGIPCVVYVLSWLSVRYEKQVLDISALILSMLGAVGCGVMAFLFLHEALGLFCLTFFVAFIMFVISFYVNYFSAWKGNPKCLDVDDDYHDDDDAMHGIP